jgi:hypothetical protein
MMAALLHAVPGAGWPLETAGEPAQNARKWYAMVELERPGRDPAWLDKAIRIVDRLVREANGKQKGKGSEEPFAA